MEAVDGDEDDAATLHFATWGWDDLADGAWDGSAGVG